MVRKILEVRHVKGHSIENERIFLVEFTKKLRPCVPTCARFVAHCNFFSPAHLMKVYTTNYKPTITDGWK